MDVNFENFKWIEILTDEANNIVIFPVSKSIQKNDDEYIYRVAYHPIELKDPFDAEELAKKIEIGFNEWNKYECYEHFSGKNTFEEKYYNTKGFKEAIKGKKHLRLGWDDIQGKYVSLSLPCKRGYAYLGIKDVKLPSEASWIDYAKVVIELISMDLTQIRSYKIYKSKLNI